MIPTPVKEALKRQQYRIIGNHSAVKICHWTKKALTRGETCYKQKWYGIQSHRCMEFTPSVIWCLHKCVWCWRLQSHDRKNLTWREFPFNSRVDEPREILERCIKARAKLLSGFGGHEKVNKIKFKEALKPTNIAISLSGEPTLYPKLSEIIEEAHKMGMTSFLVTNGTTPEKLEALKPKPSQLYVTLPAPDRETYEKCCLPSIPSSWEKINETLELFSSLNCRTVIRLTLVKGLNLKDPEKYAKLIERANPLFVEAKGYVWVGESQKRLPIDAMPSMKDIANFSEKLSELTSYSIKDEFAPSRVALLSRK